MLIRNVRNRRVDSITLSIRFIDKLALSGSEYDMYLKFLLNILNKVRDCEIDESLCTRSISPKDSCDKCIKACPLSCISIAKTIEIGSNCIDCGICSSKCPTKAITMKTPEYLRRKIKEKGFHSLGCRNIKTDNDLFKSFCIGCLSDEDILYLLVKKPSVIEDFDSSKCANCELFSGFLDFEQRKRNLTEKLEQLNFNDIKPSGFTPEDSMENEDYDEEKRRFIKSLFQLTWTNDNEVLADEDDERTFYRVYKELLDAEPQLYSVMDIDFPQKNGACCQCAACVKLCPTKALRLEDASLFLNVAQCCGCGLCEEVCYDKTLVMGRISYEEFNGKELKIV